MCALRYIILSDGNPGRQNSRSRRKQSGAAQEATNGLKHSEKKASASLDVSGAAPCQRGVLAGAVGSPGLAWNRTSRSTTDQFLRGVIGDVR